MTTQRTKEQDFVHEATPHYYDRYLGTAAALMRQGILREWQFPGQPGVGKTRATFDATGQLRRSSPAGSNAPGVTTVIRKRMDWFEVHVVVALEEQQRRAAAMQDLQQRRQALAEAKRQAAGLPRTASEYRLRRCSALHAWFQALRLAIDSDAGGFAFSQEDEAAIEQLLHDVLDVATGARVVFSEAARMATVEAIAQRHGVALQDLLAGPLRRRRHLALVSDRDAA